MDGMPRQADEEAASVNEVADVITDRKPEDAEDVDVEAENENLYLDQNYSEELGLHAFQSDSLLWQDILSTSHREVWNGLHVGI